MSNRSTLLSTTRMTPLERATGRFMRAPDHVEAPAAAAEAAPAEAAVETPAEAAPADAADGVDDNGPATLIDEATAPKDGEAPAEGEAPADDGEGDGEGDEAAADTTPFEITPPEGFEILDAEALAEATPLLRDLGVTTNEQAQEVVGKFAPIIKGMADKAVASFVDAQAVQVADIRKSWADAALADPEIGGDNDKLSASISKCGLVLDTFGSPALRETLRSTGLGNHPEVIRIFAKVADQISDATIHRPGPGAQEAKTAANVLFDNS